MTEHQNIEYKQSWRDDYLKWVCGFANALGGTIYIGKDDDGKVVGIRDHKKLMEDIPNKIHDILGVVTEVNLKKRGEAHFIEIIVPPYSVPISYRGRYYYRTGSTKRELTGSALNEFLLKKTGKTWDEVIESRTKLIDIDKKSVDIFLKSAVEAKRFPLNEKLPLKELFAKLQLMHKGKLKRAAMVLFGKEPSQFFPSMCVRIGRFGKSKIDLRFQESIEGNLIHCLRETIEQLDHKFLISPVSFEGIHRIEKWQYPLPALREAILNALIHRNYMGPHIQIEVYDDRICFWNGGTLPEELSIASLTKKHASYPRNPLIAKVCFLGGYIDAWGRGIEKIVDACRKEGHPDPVFEENTGGMLVTLFARSGKKSHLGEEKTLQKGTKLALSRHQVEILHKCMVDSDISELMAITSRSDRTKFRNQVLNPLLEENLVEMTIPDKPTSSKQKYRLTVKGQKYIGNNGYTKNKK